MYWPNELSKGYLSRNKLVIDTNVQVKVSPQRPFKVECKDNSLKHKGKSLQSQTDLNTFPWQ